MPNYVVTPDRVGRNHAVPPWRFEDVSDPNELAALIHERAKPHLMSRDVEVRVNLLSMSGQLVAGVRPAGKFTIERA